LSTERILGMIHSLLMRSNNGEKYHRISIGFSFLPSRRLPMDAHVPVHDTVTRASRTCRRRYAANEMAKKCSNGICVCVWKLQVVLFNGTL
jgi:hypothetical protein